MRHMDPVLAIVGGVVGGLVVGVVAAAFYFRPLAGRPVVDADELAVEVERIGKLVRRMAMSNLRRSALDAPEAVPPSQPAQPAIPRPLTKDEIRARVFGGRQA